ncbi:MAG: hypothetical protein CMJ83_17705 [Planctomycetes bacterium]|nr:hypothetical protein [Planctomycetota bacterium]
MKTNGMLLLAFALIVVAPVGAQTKATKPAKPAVSIPNPVLNETAPLGDVSDRMGTAAKDLGASRPKDAEVRQGHVEGHLDDLIEKLRHLRKSDGG